MDVIDLTNFIPPTRKLPHSIEAEMAFLGAILINNHAYSRPSEYLRPEHFALAEHRKIYSACVAIIDRGGVADPVTLKAVLEGKDDLAAAGGIAYLNKLVNAGVAVINAWEYGRLIYDLYLRRELIDYGERIMAIAYEDGDADLQIEAAQIMLARLPLADAAAARTLRPIDAADMLAHPIPPRQWIVGKILCRGYLTLLAASGGTGKTTLAMAIAVSCAIGRTIIGEYVHHRSRVLVLSLEDDRDEIARRLAACVIAHGIDPARLAGWLLIESMASRDGKMLKTSANGVEETAMVNNLMSTIKRQNIDVLIIDPIVKASDGDENDNRASDQLMSVMTRVAIRCNVAVIALDHTRKGTQTAGDIDIVRGGGAKKDAARIGLTLTPMTEEEAEKFGIPGPERRLHIRLDDGKVNLAAPSSDTRWYRLESVAIDNGTDAYPDGDSVQAIRRWTPPATWDGLTSTALNAVLDDIAAGPCDGEMYTHGNKATDRAAWQVVHRHAPQKTPAQCRQIIAEWIESGLLTVVEYRSPSQRRMRQGLGIDCSKRPS